MMIDRCLNIIAVEASGKVRLLLAAAPSSKRESNCCTRCKGGKSSLKVRLRDGSEVQRYYKEEGLRRQTEANAFIAISIQLRREHSRRQ